MTPDILNTDSSPIKTTSGRGHVLDSMNPSSDPSSSDGMTGGRLVMPSAHHGQTVLMTPNGSNSEKTGASTATTTKLEKVRINFEMTKI